VQALPDEFGYGFGAGALLKRLVSAGRAQSLSSDQRGVAQLPRPDGDQCRPVQPLPARLSLPFLRPALVPQYRCRRRRRPDPGFGADMRARNHGGASRQVRLSLHRAGSAEAIPFSCVLATLRWQRMSNVTASEEVAFPARFQEVGTRSKKLLRSLLKGKIRRTKSSRGRAGPCRESRRGPARFDM
jgi:hypothetical protein